MGLRLRLGGLNGPGLKNRMFCNENDFLLKIKTDQLFVWNQC